MSDDQRPPRINPEMPGQPHAGQTSEQLFADARARRCYWLPDPPGSTLPALDAFWRAMCNGITEYRKLEVTDGPMSVRDGPQSVRSYDGPQLGGASRHSNSPNWSGTSIRAGDGGSLGQIVASWIEPDVRRAGPHTDADEFRSSVWIGLNGHAAFLDAALPQMGTLQRVRKTAPEMDSAGQPDWTPRHWVWYEWWAIYKGQTIPPSVLPVYINLCIRPGDRIWCSVELIPGGLISPSPVVARMLVCVETNAGGTRHKTLIMPFVVDPPTIDGVQVRPMGSVANWIAELPTHTDPDKAFLMPEFFDTTTHSNAPLPFIHCAAGVGAGPGAPIVAERTLEVARHIHMVTGRYEDRGAIARMASPIPAPDSDTAFQIRVDGNPA